MMATRVSALSELEDVAPVGRDRDALRRARQRQPPDLATGRAVDEAHVVERRVRDDHLLAVGGQEHAVGHFRPSAAFVPRRWPDRAR
jgi:hypothetical protein